MGRGGARGVARGGAGTPATKVLTAAGLPFTVHEYDHDPRAESFGAEAARELGVEPERVFKTLLASLDPGGGARPRLVVGIVPVSTRLDLKALARVLGGGRATMAEASAAERATGMVVGGISPIGQRQPHPCALDETAELYDTVFVSAGRRGLDIELAPADLVAITSAVTAPLSR